MDALRSLLRGALSANEAERVKSERALSQVSSVQLAQLVVEDLGKNEEMLILRLACVLIRRVTVEQEDEQVLAVLFNGRVLELGNSALQNDLAQTIGPLLVRGELAPRKLAAFMRCFAERTPTSPFFLTCCVKCVKVVSLLAKEFDNTKVNLPSTFSPIIAAALDPSHCTAQNLARAAYAVRSFVHSSFYISNTSIPSTWPWQLIAVASLEQAQSLHVRCHILKALRAMSRCSSISNSSQVADFRKACFQLCTSTLETCARALEGANIDVRYETYDSDDGEPSGFQSVLAVSLELLRELLPHLEQPAGLALVGDFIHITVVGARLSPDLKHQFGLDPNEFLAFHENESMVHSPRHSSAALLEELVNIWPTHTLEQLAALKSELAVGAAQAPCSNPDAVESFLWLLGNLWFALDDGEPRLCLTLKQILYPIINDLVVAPKLDPLVRARLLWAIWACWSPQLATPALHRFIFTNLLATRDTCPSAVGVALHASRAFARLVPRTKSEWGALAAIAGPPGQVFGSLLCLLGQSSFDTVHVALETIELLVDASRAPSGPGLLAFASEQQCQALLDAMLHLWTEFGETDPFIRDSVCALLLALAERPGKSAAIMRPVVANAPLLVPHVLSQDRGAGPQSQELPQAMFEIASDLCDALRGLVASNDWPMVVTVMECFCGCARFLSANDAFARAVAPMITAAVSIVMGSPNQLVPSIKSAEPHLDHHHQVVVEEFAQQILLDTLRWARRREDWNLMTGCVGPHIAKGLITWCNSDDRGATRSSILVEISFCCVRLEQVDWLHLTASAAASFVNALADMLENQIGKDSVPDYVAASACTALLVLDSRSPIVAKCRQQAIQQLLQSGYGLAKMFLRGETTTGRAARDGPDQDLWGFACMDDQEQVSETSSMGLFLSPEDERQCILQADRILGSFLVPQ